MKGKLTGYANTITRSGDPYIVVGFLIPDTDWVGLRPGFKYFNPSSVTCKLEPGKDFDFTFDHNGHLISIEPIV